MTDTRSHAKSGLFNGMDDTTLIRHYQTKARVEPVIRDVLVTKKPVTARKDRMVYPTSYKKVR